MKRWLKYVALVIVIFVVTACGTGTSQENRTSPRVSSTTSADQSVITEALNFGGIVLPRTAQVVGADTMRGIDRLYRLVVQLDPQAVGVLLSESKFTTQLEHGGEVSMSTVPGFQPGSIAKLASAQDTLALSGEGGQTVTREVLVDRNDSTKTFVYLWLFTV